MTIWDWGWAAWDCGSHWLIGMGCHCELWSWLGTNDGAETTKGVFCRGCRSSGGGATGGYCTWAARGGGGWSVFKCPMPEDCSSSDRSKSTLTVMFFLPDSITFRWGLSFPFSWFKGWFNDAIGWLRLRSSRAWAPLSRAWEPLGLLKAADDGLWFLCICCSGIKGRMWLVGLLFTLDVSSRMSLMFCATLSSVLFRFILCCGETLKSSKNKKTR